MKPNEIDKELEAIFTAERRRESKRFRADIATVIVLGFLFFFVFTGLGADLLLWLVWGKIR